MTDTAIIEIALQTMLVALKLSAPILLTALVVGFAISLFQSMTQIQEFTLSLRAEGDRGRRRPAGLAATGCCTRWSTSPTTCSSRSPRLLS